MPSPSVSASMLIRRSPAEIFDAFVEPKQLCRFWLDAASGPLAADAEVTWHFKVPGVTDTVKVRAFERPRRMALEFGDGSRVELTFGLHDGDATRVEARCTGFPEQDLLAQATSTVEGFSIVLCDLKTLLETGRSASLVRDKAELITRAMGEAAR